MLLFALKCLECYVHFKGFDFFPTFSSLDGITDALLNPFAALCVKEEWGEAGGGWLSGLDQ